MTMMNFYGLNNNNDKDDSSSVNSSCDFTYELHNKNNKFNKA